MARCEMRGKLLARCSNRATGQCQYCGRDFCDTRGVHEADFQQICVAKVCRAKFRDVDAHRIYKRTVQQRNARALCGVEGCAGKSWGGCSKCEGIFCVDHVSRHKVKRGAGRRRSDQVVNVCRRCAIRLTLWK